MTNCRAAEIALRARYDMRLRAERPDPEGLSTRTDPVPAQGDELVEPGRREKPSSDTGRSGRCLNTTI